MLAKESIKSRLDGEQGISYTEFSYMLLQANDFVALHERNGPANFRSADRTSGGISPPAST